MESRLSGKDERKTVTALFADIKGSMELIEDLDPEQARNIIDPALRLMVEAIRRYSGYVVQSTGDGVFAIFGAPIAHEDHAQRALYAALRIHDELNRHCNRIGVEESRRVQARVGINSGEAVVRSLSVGGRAEYTPIGHSIGLAARLQALAPIGSVAVTAETRKLCDGYFKFRPLGPVRIRGVSEPVAIYEVVGLGPLRTSFQLSAERGLSSFVGRRRELEQLRMSLAAVKSGRGQIAAVLGEAGVGKSRLFHEFKILAQSECTVLETFSLAHNRETSYFPVIELLKHYFGVAEEDDKRRRREERVARLLAVDAGRVFSPWRRRARDKVTSKVLALERRLEDTLPYLFTLLGIQDSSDPLAQMDPQIRRRRTLDAVKRLLLREALNRPLLLVFEDLHWLDNETQGFLNLLVDSIANAPLLLLVNYRPDYRHEWSNKSYYNQVRLEPLSIENAAQMLDAILGERGELARLRQLIIDKTQGNPFFIEELVQALFEQGIVRRSADSGELKLTRELETLRLPLTVRTLLSSRIDRLPTREKEVLQTLAVIGRQFSRPLMSRVLDYPESELDGAIVNLQAGEFLYERPAFAEVEYVFKHALTQEVAYNSLLLERRVVLHERVAQALETLFSDAIDDHAADVAYHYSRSANASRAIDYLIRAGQQAQLRSTYSQAVAYLEQALAILEKLPPGAERDRKEIAIRAGLGDAAIVMNGYATAEYEHHLARRYELAEGLRDTNQIFYSLVGMSVLAAFRLELRKAQDIGWKLLGIADHEHDPNLQLQAHGSLANVLWLLGDFTAAREHAEKGLSTVAHEPALPAGEEHLRAACLYFTCLCTHALGYPDKALRLALEFLASSRERGQLLPVAFALNGLATVLAWRGEGVEALKYSDALLALTAEHGFSNWNYFGQVIHGKSLGLVGRAEDGVKEIKTALNSIVSTGATVPGWVNASLAFSLLTAHQPSEGLKVVTAAVDLGDQTGDAEAKAELHRLRGELTLMASPVDLAAGEASFRAALDISRKQIAKSAELRAAISLTRLLMQQDRPAEARATLSGVYDWFTEGFDTADLRDARTLLDQLN